MGMLLWARSNELAIEDATSRTKGLASLVASCRRQLRMIRACPSSVSRSQTSATGPKAALPLGTSIYISSRPRFEAQVREAVHLLKVRYTFSICGILETRAVHTSASRSLSIPDRKDILAVSTRNQNNDEQVINIAKG
nr:hypothetical protein Iba_chr01cCG5040 [Ipomoea batatas]